VPGIGKSFGYDGGLRRFVLIAPWLHLRRTNPSPGSKPRFRPYSVGWPAGSRRNRLQRRRSSRRHRDRSPCRRQRLLHRRRRQVRLRQSPHHQRNLRHRQRHRCRPRNLRRCRQDPRRESLLRLSRSHGASSPTARKCLGLVSPLLMCRRSRTLTHRKPPPPHGLRQCGSKLPHRHQDHCPNRRRPLFRSRCPRLSLVHPRRARLRRLGHRVSSGGSGAIWVRL
jgi:hypothetical protein